MRAATWFAQHGFGVFSVWSTDPDGSCRCPKGRNCDNAGKHPITPRGFHDATGDVDRIAKLLAAASEPNYGLVCPPNVFALDVDGADISKLSDLEERLGPLPETLRTKTAHGFHVFLRWPADLPQPQGKLFGFVTRFGDTGYVIGPRSVHASGKAYQPLGTTEIAEIPPNWVSASRQNGHVIHIAPAELPEVGNRHDWLRDRARYYRGFMEDRGVLRAALLAENARLPQPKTEEEVDRAIGRVYELFPPDPPDVIEDRAARKFGEDELGLLDVPASDIFPAPLSDVAYGGLLGGMVQDIAEGTDAPLVGLLGALTALCGAAVPGMAFWASRYQTTSPFIALVGESGDGRKGTSMNRALEAVGDAIGLDVVHRLTLDGISSGEGLISSLHYRQEQSSKDKSRAEPTVGLIYEEEYANLMAARGREGSTLDPKMRAAFDGGTISNRRSNDTKSVEPPYWLPAIIGITPIELRQKIEQGAMETGSANRWLYLPVAKRAVRGNEERPQFAPDRRLQLLEARTRAVRNPRGLTIGVSDSVKLTLAEYSDWLPTVSQGIAAQLVRRYSVTAFRMALIHAMLDLDDRVEDRHLDRALALVEYARSGIAWVFGSTVGNRDAELLFRALLDTGRLTYRTITQQIIRDPIRRQDATDMLVRLGLAVLVRPQTGGRMGRDLVLSTARATSVQFTSASVHYSANQRSENMAKADLVHTSAQTAAQKVHTSRTEGAQKLHTSTPETVTCVDYIAHQSSHRYTGSAWVCTICQPGTAEKEVLH